MKLLLTILFSIFFLIGFSQDSLKVVYHNILNFPGVSPERVDSLRIILQYSKPDVYVVNELQSASGADLILNDALNVFGQTKYQKATFINGPDTDNGFFYNSDKLGFINQDQIGTALRDISVYKLYYKAPNLSAQTDTIYFYFFSCHLKAGSTEYDKRNQEAKQLKYYLNSIAPEVENVFVGGDFNFYSGFESGCLTIKDEGQVKLFDPIDADGNWSSNFSFADIHTQSTRNSNGVGGDGSGGGMDDRFDIIFISDDIFDNSNGVSYIDGTYQALGQDGMRFNSTITSPSNTSVPDSVANALYWASDHLPVEMSVVLDETAFIKTEDVHELKVSYSSDYRELRFLTHQRLKAFQLLNLNGQILYEEYSFESVIKIPNFIKDGLFIWRVQSKDQIHSGKLVIN